MKVELGRLCWAAKAKACGEALSGVEPGALIVPAARGRRSRSGVQVLEMVDTSLGRRYRPSETAARVAAARDELCAQQGCLKKSPSRRAEESSKCQLTKESKDAEVDPRRPLAAAQKLC